MQISGIDNFYVKELEYVLQNLDSKNPKEITIKYLDFSASLFDKNCMITLC